MKEKNGFTLIEIVTVLGISVVLILVSMLGLGNTKRKSEFTQAQKQISSLLSEAQIRSVNQDDSSSWGVYFDNNADDPYYSLFSGTTFSTSTEKGRYLLPDSVAFMSSTVPISSNTQVAFSQITGLPIAGSATSVGIIAVSGPTTSSIIIISTSSGVVLY